LIASFAHAAEQDVTADCIQITSADARLACFDKVYGTNSRILSSGSDEDAVITSDAAVAVIPDEADFGRQKSRAELEGNSMTSGIKAVRKDAVGKLIFELENGQVWRQIENKRFSAKAGNLAEVRHGSLGSYKLYIKGKSQWTRVRRTE